MKIGFRLSSIKMVLDLKPVNNENKTVIIIIVIWKKLEFPSNIPVNC